MATRLEKIFRAKTIMTMNTILNEVSECVEKFDKTPKKEIADSLLVIAKTVDKFFQAESVSDDEIRRVVMRGKNK